MLFDSAPALRPAPRLSRFLAAFLVASAVLARETVTVEPIPLHPWGKPVSDDSSLIVLDNLAYDCGYSPSLFVSRWSAYAFTRISQSRISRHSGRFRADPRLDSSIGPTPSDYHGLWTRDLTGYDRGHQAPDAALKAFGSQAQAETYFLTNITPQHSRFNRGFWRRLETWTRNQAGETDTVWVITGPVFLADRETVRVGIENRVFVPHAYFQAVVMRRPENRILAFVVPHRASPLPWNSARAFIVGIDSIETLTGLRLFPGFPGRLPPACSSSWTGLPILPALAPP